MKETATVLRGIVRGFLTPGPHAALIEMRGQQSHRIANHLILNIGEACVERWPLTMADYNQPQGATGPVIPVKFTVRADMYPRLYQRYKSLAPGIRTLVFLNMLNRYAENARIDPAGIIAAMHDLSLANNAASGVEPPANSQDRNEYGGASQIVSSAAPESFAPERPPGREEIIEPDVDPVSMINTGL